METKVIILTGILSKNFFVTSSKAGTHRISVEIQRDYLPALKTVFESVGLDSLYYVNDFNKERFNVFMGQFSSTKLREEIMSKSSLRDYITFYRPKGKQPYLEDMRDFEGSRLKLLCRTNSLCLNNLLNKMSLKKQ